MRMTLLALAALLTSTSALADTLLTNANGIQVDRNGKLERFSGILIGDDGKVQVVTVRQGVDTELGKKIQRQLKDAKLKVQAALQDRQVRVTGKSRDELQAAIALVRRGDYELPLQFTNFRD